jgi:hypothetical protein
VGFKDYFRNAFAVEGHQLVVYDDKVTDLHPLVFRDRRTVA